MILHKSIKFRLTVWYLVVITVLLVVFGTVAYYLLRNNLFRNLDKQLQARAQDLQRTMRIEGDNNVFFDQTVEEIVLIYDADGVLRTRLGPNVQFSNIDRAVQQALFGDPTFVSAETEKGPDVRLYAAPLNVNSQDRVAIVVGRVPNEILNMLAIFRMVILNSSVLLLVLAGVGGWFLAGRTLKPVERITDIARGIGESDLSRRIDVESDDELGLSAEGRIIRMLPGGCRATGSPFLPGRACPAVAIK